MTNSIIKVSPKTASKLDQLCMSYTLISRQIKELEAQKENYKRDILALTKEQDKVQAKSWLIHYSKTAGRKGTEITQEMVGKILGATAGHMTFKITTTVGE